MKDAEGVWEEVVEEEEEGLATAAPWNVKDVPGNIDCKKLPTGKLVGKAV